MDLNQKLMRANRAQSIDSQAENCQNVLDLCKQKKLLDKKVCVLLHLA